MAPPYTLKQLTDVQDSAVKFGADEREIIENWWTA